MKENVNFKNETMDDLVFESRNKEYGAFAIRKSYAKNLLIAIGVAVFGFIFGMYTPAIAKNLGLFKDKEQDSVVNMVVDLAPPPSIKEDAPPPPPPPPVVELKAPTIEFIEIQAVEKEKAQDDVVTVDKLKDDAVISTTTQAGDPNANNPIPNPDPGTPGPPRTLSEDEVQQKPKFGKGTFQDFVDEEFDNTNVDNKSGVAEVYFTLDKNGRVIPSSIRLKRSSGNAGLDKEALRITKIQPPYVPAKNNGEAVEVQCSVKVSYSAEESDE